ncbi:alkane 1-monooxygenase [Mycolicibacterium madagascariense]|uniref:Alkane 1-monooxygenase n=2 Tax=Mycolicibacterium madagascariense TaxID=212765 RepID=A0A7I7XEE9_9MYCO|nr:alkane 1-monooxygenase [Mycolicibacterium madagascariense]
MAMELSDVEQDPADTWRDRKRHLWLMGLIVPTAVLVMLPVVWALNRFGWHGAAQVPFWIGPILVYVVLPLLDRRFGPDGENPPDEVMERLENDPYYRRCTYSFIPFQYLTVVLGAYLFTASDLSWLGFHGALGWPAKIGLALSVGMMGGVGINTAHELGHKKDSLERWLSKITLAQTCYGHFYIEHNRGHHVRVATPEDPASARFGETFWEFLPRSVWGSLTSSWRLEAQRLRRLDRSPWHWSNDVLNAWAMSVVLYGTLIAVFGLKLVPYVVISAVFGFTLLETVNYLEHYGLLRAKTESGRYERCAPQHSWNSDHIVTNLFLYHLQRHSDHHANPTRRYQTLRSMAAAPNLPSGYASMIGLAYFPPLWRTVMDHRVLAHYDGDITRVNVHPRMRARVMAKYGPEAAR